MKKPVILKEPPRNKLNNKDIEKLKLEILNNSNKNNSKINPQKNNELDKYLKFYDDIKVPNRKNDW